MTTLPGSGIPIVIVETMKTENDHTANTYLQVKIFNRAKIQAKV